MAVVEKKVIPKYFEKLLSGEKKWELRLDDFEINPGDELVLREYDADEGIYTGRELRKKVGYVAKFDLKNTLWPLEEILEKGIQIITLE